VPLWAKIAVGIVALLLVGGFVVWGYRARATWTGFVGFTRTKHDNQEYVAGKTLWDWLQLLLIPAALSVGVLLFNNWQGNRERERADQQRREDIKAAEKRAAVDRQIVVEEQRERALQTFFDEMTRLILDKGLRESKVGSNIRIVARTRTLSTLHRLDGERKGSLVRFLAESRLLDRPNPFVNIRGADLSDALLGGIDLHRAYLRDVRLYQAGLSEADLRFANLTGADFEKACLPNAHLDHAVLDDASFVLAYMYNVTLAGAGTIKPKYDHPEENSPPGFKLVGVNFFGSYLGDARGADTNLVAGTFNDAYISDETKIEGADLRGARMLPRQNPNAVVHANWEYCFSEARLRSG
jgi:uncharacterized protein YjbI with pentapeptide repeats